ncbi:MAG: PHP-associated domain-containing protein [Blautia sp.]|jgi:predicted metal-dependent phosphoesterase TrpH
MRFDMHCHTKEGSLDAKVPVAEYAKMLQTRGYGGMLTTDHNSYKGYRAWCRTKKELKRKGDPLGDFVVLKGIEYDTLDAGHILVIMPKGLRLRILEVRGLPVQMLIKIVHQYGGILGPAHPYGAKFLSAMCSKKMERDPRLIHEFDFMEVFNTCEKKDSNQKARALAQAYQKPGFGGSDSHKPMYVGTAYTDIDYPIENNNDLIFAVKNGYVLSAGGEEREEVRQGKLWKLVPIATSWKVYNRGLALIKRRTRQTQLEFLKDMDSIRKTLLGKKYAQKKAADKTPVTETTE